MNDVLYDVLLALITAVVSVVARYLIPYVRTKLKNSKYTWASEIVEAVVYAIEQTHGSALGYDKKKKATDMIRRMLSASGLSLTDDQISMLIESVVGAMNADKPEAEKGLYHGETEDY